jgi:hypothetical protein
MRSETTIFLLTPDDLPRVLQEWMDMLYPDDEWREWFVEKNRVYGGQSPQQALSVRHDRDPESLRRNVGRMVDGFYRVLSFVTVPYVTSKEEVYDEVVAAQVRVRARVLNVELNRRVFNPFAVKTPSKLFSCPVTAASPRGFERENKTDQRWTSGGTCHCFSQPGFA